MRSMIALAATVGVGLALVANAPIAQADDWSIGIGVGLPGVVIVPPGPAYAPPPPYYGPAYPPAYPPGYAPPPPYYGGYYGRDPGQYYGPPGWHRGDDDDDE